MQRRPGLTAVIVAAAIGLAACGGSSSVDPGRTLPPVSPHASSAAQSPAADPPNHLTKKQELAAAEATVRHYFKILNALDRHSSVNALERIETPGCPCRRQVASLRTVQRSNERYVVRVRVKALQPILVDRTHVNVLALFDAARSGVETSAGKLTQVTPAKQNVQQQFMLHTDQGRWVINRIELFK